MTQIKNNYLISSVISWTFILLISCSPNTPEQKLINEMHDEIMVVHDEVMPKMTDIYKLRKNLQKQTDPQTKEARDAAVIKLDEAEEAMMAWMSQYKKPKASQEDFELYLDAQLLSVSKMKKTMLDALAIAKELKDE